MKLKTKPDSQETEISATTSRSQLNLFFAPGKGWPQKKAFDPGGRSLCAPPTCQLCELGSLTRFTSVAGLSRWAPLPGAPRVERKPQASDPGGSRGGDVHPSLLLCPECHLPMTVSVTTPTPKASRINSLPLPSLPSPLPLPSLPFPSLPSPARELGELKRGKMNEKNICASYILGSPEPSPTPYSHLRAADGDTEASS